MSVISNTVLVGGKLAIGWMIGSVSVISEGIHSSLDLVAAMIALFAVRAAAQPPDERHQYGHGKMENVSGTIEALLIFVAAIWIIYEGVQRLLHPQPLETVGWGIAVMAVSAITNWFISTYLMRVGKETESVALQADALHLRTDVYTSVGVVVGLIAVAVTGLSWLDPVAAIAVAFFIIHASWELTRESFLPLLDTRLPEEEEKLIEEGINQYADRFQEFHKLRTRRSGAERHVDLHLVVCRHQTMQEAHELAHNIEDEIQLRSPKAQVLIHQEPCERECFGCSDEGRHR